MNNDNPIMRVRFRCEAIDRRPEGDALRFRVALLPPARHQITEERLFFNATPAGELILQLLKPETSAQFVPGQDYYLDFSPAPAT
jgi:hypothetical protein